ncbi:HIT family protein [Labilibaculum euxinus]
MHHKCLVCERISKILNHENPYFVAELETGYVVLGDFQFFKGYVLLLCKQHKTELHQLDDGFKMKFLKEMSEVAEAVHLAFQPKKINYEMLGNAYSHLHWHIIPRYEDDPNPLKPIWTMDSKIINAEETRPNDQELSELKEKLMNALKTTVGSDRSVI